MPVKLKKVGGVYRVVESATGRIVRNRSGSAVDGGGYKSLSRAKAQVSAINISLRRKKRS